MSALARWARLGMTRALAVELAPHGILVNHIVPGAFDTSRVEGQSAPAGQPAGVPVGRLGMLEEIAKTVAFPCFGRGKLRHRTDDTRERRGAEE